MIPLLNDCVRVLDETGVTPEDLDTGMTSGAGWPMGPCALLDLVGADVHVHASEALYEKLREQRMAAPPRLVRPLVTFDRERTVTGGRTNRPLRGRRPRSGRASAAFRCAQFRVKRLETPH